MSVRIHCVLFFLVAAPLLLSAQSRDTVRVKTNEAHPFISRYYHWSSAQYLWTVSGSGNFGQIGSQQIEADARFLTKELTVTLPDTEITFPVGTKFPLFDDPGLEDFCNLTSFGVCRTYFATNATGENNLLVPFDISDSANRYIYRFIPDKDEFDQTHMYTSVVSGSDRKGEFMYMDRYNEEDSNSYYNDNYTNGEATTFLVDIQRKSPEFLVIKQPYQILNDGAVGEIPDKVFREESLNFGTVPVTTSGGAIIYKRTLRNRGLDPMQIQRIEIEDPVGTNAQHFRIVRSDGLPLSSSIVLNRDISDDSLELAFMFEPKSGGPKSIEVRVYCDDPTQNSSTDGTYFRFFLDGTGTEARLDSLLPVIDFGSVRFGDQKDSTLIILSTGEIAANIDTVTGLDAPFSFSAERMPSTSSPLVIEPLMSDSLRLTFRPLAKGDFMDTLILSGNNIQDYKVIVKGRGLVSSAVIYIDTLDYTRDTLDFGSALPGDVVIRPVYILNTGNIPLRIREPIQPSYSIEISPNLTIDPNDKNEFGNATSLATSFLIDTSDKPSRFFMKFAPSLSVVDYPLGRKEALLILSLVEHDDPVRPESTTSANVIATRSFLLVGNKVERKISAESDIRFDSVYVFPNPVPRMTLHVINGSDKAVTIASASIRETDVTRDFEFLPGADFPLTLESGADQFFPEIAYHPNERGPDTAFLVLHYFSPKDDSLVVRLTGTGVQQQLDLISAIGNLPSTVYTRSKSNDTVYMGKIEVGTQQPCNLLFRNNGNLPFGLHPADDQHNGQLISNITGQQPDYYVLDKPFKIDGYIPVDSLADARIIIQPYKRGRHVLGYRLPSDIGDPVLRNIKGEPDTALTKIIYITFEGIQPGIHTNVDSLDFGNVVVLGGCNLSASRKIVIRNNGNALLDITKFGLKANAPFRLVTPARTTLQPNNSLELDLIFQPDAIGSFSDELLLISNAEVPSYTLRIPMSGNGIAPPSIGVGLPSVVRAKPGRLIEIPIKLDRQNLAVMQAASAVDMTITYDPTLLEFASVGTIGTATEGAAVVVPSAPEGSVNISVQGVAPFADRDTLIFLYFKTYLGNAAATSLALGKIEFTHKTCTGVLKVASSSNGIFALDSVCYLSNLLGSPATGSFRLGQIAPNPIRSSEAAIDYEVAFATLVTIDVFNAQGERVVALVEGWQQPGSHQVSLPPTLSAGIYFYEMRAGIFHEVRKMSIVR